MNFAEAQHIFRALIKGDPVVQRLMPVNKTVKIASPWFSSRLGQAIFLCMRFEK